METPTRLMLMMRVPGGTNHCVLSWINQTEDCGKRRHGNPDPSDADDARSSCGLGRKSLSNGTLWTSGNPDPGDAADARSRLAQSLREFLVQLKSAEKAAVETFRVSSFEKCIHVPAKVLAGVSPDLYVAPSKFRLGFRVGAYRVQSWRLVLRFQVWRDSRIHRAPALELYFHAAKPHREFDIILKPSLSFFASLSHVVRITCHVAQTARGILVRGKAY